MHSPLVDRGSPSTSPYLVGVELGQTKCQSPCERSQQVSLQLRYFCYSSLRPAVIADKSCALYNRRLLSSEAVESPMLGFMPHKSDIHDSWLDEMASNPESLAGPTVQGTDCKYDLLEPGIPGQQRSDRLCTSQHQASR
jgi:hypothetical protein